MKIVYYCLIRRHLSFLALTHLTARVKPHLHEV